MTKINILLLRCCKSDFEKLSSGEMTSRFLEAKPYWEKRIFDTNGNFKHFDEVHIKNGYKTDSPEIHFIFLGFGEKSDHAGVASYEVKLGDILS